MIELVSCILCAFMGAGIAILFQKVALNRYFDLVECLWNNDLKRIDQRINALIAKKER